MAYITELEKQIHYYLIQEWCTPERFAARYKESDPDEWNRAWSLWEEWTAQQWKVVAIAHAGKPLSESEFLSEYGEWQDRESEPGHRLFRIINKDKRPQ